MPPAKSNSFQAIEVLVLVSFLSTLHLTVFSPLMSDYLREVLGSDQMVGVIDGAARLWSLPVNLGAIWLILKIGKLRLILLLFGLLGWCDAVFLWTHQPLVSVLNYMLLISVYPLLWFCLNLLLKRYSHNLSLHTDESKLYLSSNLAWLVGPAVGGWVATEYGFAGVFPVMLIIAVLSFWILWQARHRFDPVVPSAIKHSENLPLDLAIFFRERLFRFNYGISFFLYLYYAVMAMYFPLYLLSLSVPLSQIGLIFSLAMLPFVLLVYPIGRVADRIGGERFIFALGFLIIALSLALISSTEDLRLLGLLYMTGSSGAAMIESLNESLFLKKVRKHQTAMQGILNTASTLGWFISVICCSLFLVFFEMRWIFLGLSPFLLLFSLLSLRKTIPTPQIDTD